MSEIAPIAARPLAPAATGDGAGPVREGGPPSEVREAAKGFEAVLLSNLVEEMLAGTSLAEANPIYAGMIVDGLGSQLAETGGLGLAALLERQLGGER